MEKIFTGIDGREYTVVPCTAIASTAGDTERQNALYVYFVDESGEKFDRVVFGWEMPEDDEAWADMCEDEWAWSDDVESVEFAE